MTRLLIIGNSHTAALRYAWPLVSDRFPDVELRFFVVGGKPFACFGLDEEGTFRCLDREAATPADLAHVSEVNGALSVDCRWADRLLYIGRDYGETVLAQMCAAWDIDTLGPDTGRPRLSRPAFDAFCESTARSRLPEPAWGKLPGRVTFAGAPFASEALARHERYLGAARAWKPLMEGPSSFAQASQVYDGLCARLLRERNIEFAPQPPETRNAAGFTLERFQRIAPEKNTVDGEALDDFRHMNDDYGRARLGAYLGAIAAA